MISPRATLAAILNLLLVTAGSLHAQSPDASTGTPRVVIPTSNRPTAPARPVDPASRVLYPWRTNVTCTVFWIGESATDRNPTPNFKSSWDQSWSSNYGGFDDPTPQCRIADFRSGEFRPKSFSPKLNPFYIALPYCDIQRGQTKPEVKSVVPWFRDCFQQSGKSVLKGRWIAIHHGGRTAFAQWEDCGPFRTDHWQYVFGNGSVRPRPNLNRGAGLDISPAVRDYLGMGKNDLCDWKFVEAGSVPDGPWKYYGDNNTFVLMRKGANLYQRDRNNAKRTAVPTYTTRPSNSSVPLSGSSAGVRVSPTFGSVE